MLNRERVPGTGLVLMMESSSRGPFDIQMQVCLWSHFTGGMTEAQGRVTCPTSLYYSGPEPRSNSGLSLHLPTQILTTAQPRHPPAQGPTQGRAKR